MPRPFKRVAASDSASQPFMLGKLALQLTGADAVLVGEILFHVDGVFFLHDLIEALAFPMMTVSSTGILVIFEMVLLQEGKTLARGDDDIAVGGLQLSGKNL